MFQRMLDAITKLIALTEALSLTKRAKMSKSIKFSQLYSQQVIGRNECKSYAKSPTSG